MQDFTNPSCKEMKQQENWLSGKLATGVSENVRKLRGEGHPEKLLGGLLRERPWTFLCGVEKG